MGHYIKTEFMDEAARAIEQIGKFTGRGSDEVISDALRTYLWILHEQAAGRTIVSKSRESSEEQPIVDLIRNKAMALSYFADAEW